MRNRATRCRRRRPRRPIAALHPSKAAAQAEKTAPREERRSAHRREQPHRRQRQRRTRRVASAGAARSLEPAAPRAACAAAADRLRAAAPAAAAAAIRGQRVAARGQRTAARRPREAVAARPDERSGRRLTGRNWPSGWRRARWQRSQGGTVNRRRGGECGAPSEAQLQRQRRRSTEASLHGMREPGDISTGECSRGGGGAPARQSAGGGRAPAP